MTSAPGADRVGAPECDDMAIRTDRRFPQRACASDFSMRNRRQDASLLIVDNNIAAVLDQYPAAITTNGRRGPGSDLRFLLIVGRIGRVVVVDNNEAIRSLIHDESAIGTDRRRADREAACRRLNCARDT